MNGRLNQEVQIAVACPAEAPYAWIKRIAVTLDARSVGTYGIALSGLVTRKARFLQGIQAKFARLAGPATIIDQKSIRARRPCSQGRWLDPVACLGEELAACSFQDLDSSGGVNPQNQDSVRRNDSIVAVCE